MIVLLEGGDKAGKTTLANGLVEKLGAKYAHFGPPDTDDFGAEFVERIAALDYKVDWVLDRAHIGEFVYGPLLRGQIRMNDYMFEWSESYLKKRDGILIWVDTDPEVCFKRAQGTTDEATLAHFFAVDELYKTAYAKSTLVKTRFQGPVEALIKTLEVLRAPAVA